MKQKKVLLLDAMGVIFPFPEGDDIKYGLWPFLEQSGFALSEKGKHDFEMGPYRAATRGEIKSTEFLKQILPSNVGYAKIENAYLQSNFFSIAENLILILKELSNNYIIGMLSNDIGNWSDYLRKRFKLDKYFDFVAISSNAKARKPEKEIYQFSLQIINQKFDKPEEIFFVDDSLKNLETASLFGIKTIYKILKSNDKSLYIPDFKIHALKDLLTIL